MVGDRLLVVTDRGNVDELGRERQQISHAVTPCSRRTSFNCALSWRSPSFRRLMTSTHGKPNFPPLNFRFRVPDTATHQDGTEPRQISLPASTSITGIEEPRIT